jgi:hypothetical protein
MTGLRRAALSKRMRKQQHYCVLKLTWLSFLFAGLVMRA